MNNNLRNFIFDVKYLNKVTVNTLYSFFKELRKTRKD